MKKRVVIAAVASAVLGASVGTVAYCCLRHRPAVVDTEFEAIRTRVAIEDYGQAIAKLQTRVAEKPTDPQSRLLLAHCYAHARGTRPTRTGQAEATEQLRVLVNLGPAGCALLVDTLRSGDPRLLPPAIAIAGEKKVPEAVEPLLELVAAKNHSNEAYEALAKIGGPRAMAALKQRFDAQIASFGPGISPQQRRRLLEQYLPTLTPEARIELATTSTNEDTLGALIALRSVPTADLRKAILMRKDLDLRLRIGAVRIYYFTAEGFRTEEHLPPLLELTSAEHPPDLLGWTVCKELARHRPDLATGPLMRYLKAPEYRREALRALLGSRNHGVPALVEALSRTDVPPTERLSDPGEIFMELATRRLDDEAMLAVAGGILAAYEDHTVHKQIVAWVAGHRRESRLPLLRALLKAKNPRLDRVALDVLTPRNGETQQLLGLLVPLTQSTDAKIRTKTLDLVWPAVQARQVPAEDLMPLAGSDDPKMLTQLILSIRAEAPGAGMVFLALLANPHLPDFAIIRMATYFRYHPNPAAAEGLLGRIRSPEIDDSCAKELAKAYRACGGKEAAATKALRARSRAAANTQPATAPANTP